MEDKVRSKIKASECNTAEMYYIHVPATWYPWHINQII